MGVWLRKSSHRIHRIHRSFVASVLPRISRICTEVLLRRFSHGIHGFAQMAWLRLFSHGIHGIHRSFVASVLPQISRICTDGLVALIRPRNSQNSQKFCCVGSPTEFTEFTEVWGRCWLRGYGRMPYPPNLCASVRICGRLFSARRFRVFCAFCGNIVSHGFHRSTQMVGCVCSPTEFTEFTEVWGAVGCVGMAGCHTLLHLCKSVLSVGDSSLQETSVRSVGSVGI